MLFSLHSCGNCTSPFSVVDQNRIKSFSLSDGIRKSCLRLIIHTLFLVALGGIVSQWRADVFTAHRTVLVVDTGSRWDFKLWVPTILFC